MNLNLTAARGNKQMCTQLGEFPQHITTVNNWNSYYIKNGVRCEVNWVYHNIIIIDISQKLSEY